MASVVTYKPEKKTVEFYEKNYKSLNKGVTEAVENFPIIKDVVMNGLYEKFTQSEVSQIMDMKSVSSFSALESSMVEIQAQIIGGEIGDKIAKLTKVECIFLMEYAINSNGKNLKNFKK